MYSQKILKPVHRREMVAYLEKHYREIAFTRLRYGYRRIHVILKREGWQINHKRVYRIYCEEGLNIRNRSKRKKVSVPSAPEKNMPAFINECWAMAFVSDQLYDGKRFRALTLIDTYSRECLGCLGLLESCSFGVFTAGNTD